MKKLLMLAVAATLFATAIGCGPAPTTKPSGAAAATPTTKP